REVVGGGELLAVEAIGDHDILAVGIETHDCAPARAAAEEPPVLVVAKTVGAVRAGAPFGYRSGFRVVAQDAVLPDLREEKAFAVPYRAFGDVELGVGLQQQFEFPDHWVSLLQCNRR